MTFFIASPWRNKESVEQLADAIAKSGHVAESFLTCGANLTTGKSVNDEYRAFQNALLGWEDDPVVTRIFNEEIGSIARSDAVILLEPSGRSSLAEAGIAYGMRKPVILVGFVERPEMIYHLCTYRYAGVDAFLANLMDVARAAASPVPPPVA